MGDVRVTGQVRASGATGEELAPLLRLAAARPELAWPTDGSAKLTQARNAHRTNTRAELSSALRSDYNWLEGDVRLDASGDPVMLHTAGGKAELTLDQWLQVAAVSGRGVKIQLEEFAALEPALEHARASGIPDERISLNVGMWPAPDLLKVRRAFPDSTIAVARDSGSTTNARDIVAMQLASRIVGGQVSFPIRQDLVTPGLVRALRPYGHVSVWHGRRITNPDERIDTARMRAIGVDGVVDLHPADSRLDRALGSAVQGTARVFGWDPVHRALDGVGLM